MNAPSMPVRPGETMREIGRTEASSHGHTAAVAIVETDRGARVRLGVWLPQREKWITLDLISREFHALLPYLDIAAREVSR